MLEMLTEKEHKRQLQPSGSGRASPPSKLQVCHLAYKSQSPDLRNNTTAAALMHKDFNKQAMSLSSSSTPPSSTSPGPLQRTFDPSLHTDRGGEVLTVVV